MDYPLTKAALDAFYLRESNSMQADNDLDCSVREALWLDAPSLRTRDECLSMTVSEVRDAIGYDQAQAYLRAGWPDIR